MIPGVDQVTVDGVKETVTVIGNADPVCVAQKLRKKLHRSVGIDTVGPNKTEEKKVQPDHHKELPFCCSHCNSYTTISIETEPGCTIMWERSGGVRAHERVMVQLIETWIFRPRRWLGWTWDVLTLVLPCFPLACFKWIPMHRYSWRSRSERMKSVMQTKLIWDFFNPIQS